MILGNSDKIEVRFSGAGGQGLVLLSIIFADVLVETGYNVIQAESHGIEARGGASRGEIIASKEEITDLSVTKPDILVCLSQESINKYHEDIKDTSLVIVDSFMIEDVPEVISSNLYKFPLTSKTKETLGSILPTNIVSLGIIAGLTDINDYEIYKNAIKNRIPEGTEEMNIKAFKLGVEMTQKA